MDESTSRRAKIRRTVEPSQQNQLHEPEDTAERLHMTMEELHGLRDENSMLRMLISQQYDIFRCLADPSLLESFI